MPNQRAEGTINFSTWGPEELKYALKAEAAGRKVDFGDLLLELISRGVYLAPLKKDKPRGVPREFIKQKKIQLP